MKWKLRPLAYDISKTFTIEIIVLVVFLVVYRLIAQGYGSQGVGEYALIRRILAFLQPISILGISVAVPRYLSMTQNSTEKEAFLTLGALIVLIMTAFVLLIFTRFHLDLSHLLFGDIKYDYLMWPLFLFLAGLNFHQFTYASLRGQLKVEGFNALQLTNALLILVFLIFFMQWLPLNNILKMIGYSMMVISILFFSKYNFSFLSFSSLGLEKVQKTGRQLLSYGVPRVWGDFLLAGLFALGPILVSHMSSIKHSGYLSLSITLLLSSGGIVAPIGIIILPKFSHRLSQGENDSVQLSIHYLIGALIQCFTFLSIQLLVLSDILLKCWLGEGFEKAVPIARVVLSSLLFYGFYQGSKNVLDSLRDRPLNALNIMISLGVFFSCVLFLFFGGFNFSPLFSLAIATACSTTSLGILSYIALRKCCPNHHYKDLGSFSLALILSIILGSLTYLAKPWLEGSLIYVTLFEGFIGSVYIFILWLMKTDWIYKIYEHRNPRSYPTTS